MRGKNGARKATSAEASLLAVIIPPAELAFRAPPYLAPPRCLLKNRARSGLP